MRAGNSDRAKTRAIRNFGVTLHRASGVEHFDDEILSPMAGPTSPKRSFVPMSMLDRSTFPQIDIDLIRRHDGETWKNGDPVSNML